MGIKESAKEYNALGFQLVAMKSGHKGPQTANWHQKGVDVDQLTDNQNIGLIHNLSSTCSLDIDNRDDAIKVFQDYLGMDATAMKSAYPCWRGSREGIKFLFRMPNLERIGIKKLTYKEGDNVVTVFELRGSTGSTACHDLLPPSIHPTGIPYEWVTPLPHSFEEIPLLPDRLIELWENWDVEEKAMLHCLGKFTPEPIKRQLPTKNDSADVIDLFNKNYTPNEILERNGYIKKGENRYLSPHSKSKTPGTVVLSDGTIYSHHGADLLSDGHSHDAFDVVRILESNSDWKTAFNNARSNLGMEQVVYENPTDKRPFKFFHASEAIDNATPPKWVIRGVLEEDTLVGLFGPPKTGKSFISIDMAASVATGNDWHEKKTKQGLVLYICGEGVRGLSTRFLAYEQIHKTPLKNSKLHYSERGVQMLDNLDAEMMRNEALALQDTYKESPKLIVIDTLARNFGPGNENSTEDMNKFVGNLDKYIREEFRCATMIVHHTGYNESGRGRGSSVLPAALDAEYRVVKNDGVDNLDWTIDLEQTLIKDGRGMSPMRFSFNECEFMHLLDEEGQPTTSGALISIPWQPTVTDKPLGDAQKTVLETLQRLYYEKLSREGMEKDVFVTQKELREACGFDITKAKKRLIDLGHIDEVETHKYLPVKKDEQTE